MTRRRIVAVAVAASLYAVPAAAQAPAAPVFVTLGTMGGPVPVLPRSQPANAILFGDTAWLVDAGDGAVQQLAKAGVMLPRVKALFLSHLHFDHTGGVGALLGLRYQNDVPGKLAIYGPPGTRALIDGILASMKPAAEAGYGLPGATAVDPRDTVSVQELADGETLRIGDVTVCVAQNTHYSFAAGSDQDRRFKSFSYRFDLPGRSIVYTGDTGPSPAVERLGKGADMLVSEMIDPDATIALVRRTAPNLTPAGLADMARHLTQHHLTPDQVGEMAARMGVSQLVVTHLAGPTGRAEQLPGYVRTISARFHGKVAVAEDLDRF